MSARAWMGIGAVVVAAAAAGWWWMGRGDGVAPTTQEEAEVTGPSPTRAPGAARLEAAGGPAARGDRAGHAATGRAVLAGTVRRDGKVVPARVAMLVQPAPSTGEESDYVEERMRLPETPPGPARETTAGDDGKFSFDAVPAGTASVLATTPDGAIGFATVTVAVDGERASVDVQVEARGLRLQGRVVHADGRPWKGRLAVSPQPVDAILGLLGKRPLETDDEGRFTIAGLVAGPVTVRAVEPGVFSVSGPSVRVPTSAEYVLTLEGDTFEVKGRVVRAEDGEGLAGARVFAWSRGEPGEQRGGVAGEDGRFALQIGDSKPYVSAKAEGYGESAAREVTRDGPEIELRLARTGSVVGRVTTVDGKPAEGAIVHSTGMPEGDVLEWFDPHPATTTSDAQGRYELHGLKAGRRQFFVRGGGRLSKELSGKVAPDERIPITTVVAGKDVVVDLVVVPAPRIVGVVLDPAGARVSGAHVQTAVHGSEGDSVLMLGAVASDSRSRFAADVAAAATAADGTFAVDGVIPGVEYDVTAVAPGSPAGKASAVAVGEDDAHVEIRLPPARWVEVTVLDAGTGAPIPKATVAVTVKKERDASVVTEDGLELPEFDFDVSHSDAQGGPSTDPAGRVRGGPAGPGRLEVKASAEGYLTNETAVAVAGSDTRDDGLVATVRLEHAFAIEGRVRMPDGKPAADVSVHATAEGAQHPSWQNETTDATGAFRVGSLRKGRHEVTASLEGEKEWIARATVEAGTTDLVLTLVEKAAGPKIVVRVVDPAGKPIHEASAEFEWKGPSGSGSNSTSVKDGLATLREEALEGADVVTSVTVSEAKGTDGERLPLGSATLSGLRPGTEAVLRLPPEKTIEGHVVGTDGKPVADARVSAKVAPQSDAPQMTLELPFMFDGGAVTTDVTGAFRVRGLGDGAYVLRVEPPAAFVKPAPVRAEAGATGVVITVRSGAAPVVTVLGVGGTPVPGAKVTAAKEDPDDKHGSTLAGFMAELAALTTGVDGRVRLPSLDPSVTYLLRVSPPASRSDLAPARFKHWTPADLSLRLERGFVVSGFVRDPAGNAIETAKVTCAAKGGDGETYRSGVGHDGTFRFGGLRAGPVELTAKVGEGFGGDAAGVTTTVAAPAEGVVLTLDRGVSITLRIEGWAEYTERWGYARLHDGKDQVAGQLVREGGIVTFAGLKPDVTYAIWVPPDKAGRLVYVAGVRGGGEVATKLTVGKPITGRALAPRGVTVAEVSIDERGVSLDVVPGADGTFRFVGVPDGTWTVRASATVGSTVYEGQAQVDAGGTGDVELKPGK